jgi:Rrf2 family iron-sulfur cluster assembly transcriptional regulator
MKLTTKGRYAVMALADLARFDNGSPISLRDISLRQGISLLYLEQIFSKLKKDNIVKSIRGVNGGYILTKNPHEIKLSNIFSAVHEEVRTTKCITHNLWDELEVHIQHFFNKKNLGDLIKGNNENRI